MITQIFEQNSEMEKPEQPAVKLTKASLSKFLTWTASAYNNHVGYGSKKENVDRVYKALKEGNYKGQESFFVQCAGPVGENPDLSRGYRMWRTKQHDEDYQVDCKHRKVTAKYSGREIRFKPEKQHKVTSAHKAVKKELPVDFGYTTKVAKLIHNPRSAWLIHEVSKAQRSKAIQKLQYQVWILIYDRKKKTGKLTLEDGWLNQVLTKQFVDVDFPTDEIKMYYEENTLMYTHELEDYVVREHRKMYDRM